MAASFNETRTATAATLELAGQSHHFHRLDAIPDADVVRLPYSLRVLLENAVRTASEEEVRSIISWDPVAPPSAEVLFRPARVLMHDTTGVPAMVDLAAMREAMHRLGGDVSRVVPRIPAVLVIDHSLQVEWFADDSAMARNVALEYERNRERYEFLRWCQEAFDGFDVVPPNTGILHQVNVELLTSVVISRDGWVFPDTLVGSDSHTTMVNGMGVLGWGVGGIEAGAAMVGEPLPMLVPRVVGVRITGALREGATATDLVLRATELLRSVGVVGAFVEYFGPGLGALSVADRATLANMCPEYGASCGFFPVDEQTLGYLRLTGRKLDDVALVEAYCKENLLWRDDGQRPEYSDVVDLDLDSIEPSVAGPRRPQDRVPLERVRENFSAALGSFGVAFGDGSAGEALTETFPGVAVEGTDYELRHGAVVIAAITSCTNTSNPSVMVAAGLLARRAVARGLVRRPWVKSSLAPGSRVVTEYLRKAGLDRDLNELGFQVVGYGCTTCIGASGPLPPAIAAAVGKGDLAVCAVLSGNRNFEARIHPDVKANYLASPPLVVAYALAGRIDVDLVTEPLATDSDGRDVFLRDLWPSQAEIDAVIAGSLDGEMFRTAYADVYAGDERWRALDVPAGARFAWDPASTYIRCPPHFDHLPAAPLNAIVGARCLVMLGDFVTTDHISPAGAIGLRSAAGRWLAEQGVERREFNTYATRRGNHEVLARGAFGNVRLRNRLVSGREGPWTVLLPSGEEMSIHDAAGRYHAAGVPTIVLAGRDYGVGSSRDWAAKGPRLLGVRAVIAESFERIHRSNLLMMGVLPLQFLEGQSIETLGLTGREEFSILGLDASEAEVTADGKRFPVRVRLDTARERDYLNSGGILPHVLDRLSRDPAPG